MRQFSFPKLLAAIITVILVSALLTVSAFAQSKKQVPTETPKGTQKKNQRPTGTPDDKEKQDKKEEEKAELDPEVLKIATNLVNVDAVVYNKKTNQIVTGLKKENFAIFENGVKQEITNFATPESPITVSVVVEFSKWTETFGRANGGGFEPGTYEVLRPVAYFVSNFIKPPDDYASIIAFDMRPTPITDFTNDPARLRQSVDLLLRNSPAFRENNVWDAINFSLMGGKGDTVVLENSKEKYANYAGMIEVKSRRRALLLVTSGIDTFSKITYDKVRKIVQAAGVPVYIIGTGNLFFKKYEQFLPPTDDIASGLPGRMTFLQANNALGTIARESGGGYYPITFEGEVPGVLKDINAFLRNQYSLAYDVTEKPHDGKKYKLEVKVDINGDGVYEDKEYVVQHRPFYTAPKDGDKK
jgi:Ca-activated chloride channel family protein